MSNRCKNFRQEKAIKSEKDIIEEYASYFNNGLEEYRTVIRFTNGRIISRDVIEKIIKRTGEKGTEAQAIYNVIYRKTAGVDAGKTALVCYYKKLDAIDVVSTFGYDFASPDDAQAFIDEFEGMEYSEEFGDTERVFYYNLGKSLECANTIAKAKDLNMKKDKTK